MTELTLIRHGQANTGARSEESYDRLSELGHQQAAWLGEYYRDHDDYRRIISGTLRRQIDTAQGINKNGLPHEKDARLNELNYFTLAAALERKKGTPFPDTPEGFVKHMQIVMDHWRDDDLEEQPETYHAFRSRIMAALHDIADMPGKSLVVTSSGVIATLIALALDLDHGAKAKIILPVSHTSVHKFEMKWDDLYLTQYAATPHLDYPERRHARTFV